MPKDELAGQRRRRHRRVSRPATGGDPQRALQRLDEAETTDADWAGAGGTDDPRTKAVERDRWWQEQRPPHWE
ncbi:hypothetical protein [Leekyejoonella antrihumi]|uniref:Uncharacterized protein n=1 Tax=Leekyejoonella antrihumi TaxID=1660198 RepID=A0A563E7Y9_9MICO|nr:hypothetical protein [Leekyejoonella antrihumi]TWP38627.1 hypothetical protein FGL98_02245 [Leekyejoonella antrihumi]